MKKIIIVFLLIFISDVFARKMYKVEQWMMLDDFNCEQARRQIAIHNYYVNTGYYNNPENAAWESSSEEAVEQYIESCRLFADVNVKIQEERRTDNIKNNIYYEENNFFLKHGIAIPLTNQNITSLMSRIGAIGQDYNLVEQEMRSYISSYQRRREMGEVAWKKEGEKTRDMMMNMYLNSIPGSNSQNTRKYSDKSRKDYENCLESNAGMSGSSTRINCNGYLGR